MRRQAITSGIATQAASALKHSVAKIRRDAGIDSTVRGATAVKNNQAGCRDGRHDAPLNITMNGGMSG